MNFNEKLAARNAALDAIACEVEQPDLSEWETTIPGSAGKYAYHPPHKHGTWKVGHTASGHARWHCDGCGFSPNVLVRLPDTAQAIHAEWWDGYCVSLASALIAPR